MTIKPTSFILEPEGRNTVSAIALGVRHILETHGDDTKCLVLAADHLITAMMLSRSGTASREI